MTIMKQTSPGDAPDLKEPFSFCHMTVEGLAGTSKESPSAAGAKICHQSAR